MAMSGYVRRIREKVGHDHVLIPASGALVRDCGGRVLLVGPFEGHRQLPGGATGADETQDVRWFSPAELRGPGLRQSTRATLRSPLPAT